MVTELTDSTFDSFIDMKGVVLVDCWAPWCRPCKMLAPVIEELAEELKGKVSFGKLNTDENQGIAMRFSINAIPTMLVFKDGVQMESLVGWMPKEGIRDHLLGL